MKGRRALSRSSPVSSGSPYVHELDQRVGPAAAGAQGGPWTDLKILLWRPDRRLRGARATLVEQTQGRRRSPRALCSAGPLSQRQGPVSHAAVLAVAGYFVGL